jgi:hypothetical protein
MGKYEWLFYVALAGLAWGTYVPIIFYGGGELTLITPGKPVTPSGRVMAILCVGGAYFVIGVLLPLLMFATGWLGVNWGDVNKGFAGLTFAGLAGVAGAVGAICVVFATSSAIGAARGAGLAPDTYKVFIAPLIFGLAPIINVLVSMVWHPAKGDPWHFGLKSAHPLLWVGIVLVGLGAGLVLYSKELTEAAEAQHKAAAKPPATSPALGAAAGATAHLKTEPSATGVQHEPKP